MASGDDLKKSAVEWVEENHKRLSDFHLEIWNYAEPAWREYRSSKAYVDLLRDEGFEVEEGSGEMPTAFVARWGEGKPVLGTYAEYDAVPGNSQQVVPYRAPREGLHPWAAGHTDPHSALGVGALAGVLATKHVMEMDNIGGTLLLFGEPAEKVCGSKPIHAAKGYYDGADAFISYHPYPGNTTVWDTHCGSYWSCVFTFEALETEPWVDPGLVSNRGGSHTRPRSPGANFLHGRRTSPQMTMWITPGMPQQCACSPVDQRCENRMDGQIGAHLRLVVFPLRLIQPGR